MKIFLCKNDLQRSLEKSEKQLLSIERTVKSLENLCSDPKKSDEFDLRVESLQLMVKRFVKQIAETRIILAFYLRRPDRFARLIDDERAVDLAGQLTSFEGLWPLAKSLEGVVARARTVRSVDERIEYVDSLRVNVSGLKESLAGWTHALREVIRRSTDRPRLRLLKGVINALVAVVVTNIALMFASNTLVNLPEWFQMLITFIVAIGIFVSCLRGKPPVIALLDLA